MRITSRALGLAFTTALLAAAPAAAGVPHVVQPGETLWTIAAANNFTTRSLAAANGLSENSNVVLGSTITIPSEAEAASALASSSAPAASTAPATGGGYAVQPGDTLSGIAAAHGVSLSALAAAHGLSTTSFAIAGTTLQIPSGTMSAPSASPSSSGPPPLGGYTVRLGDSLSSIAAHAGVSMQQVAWVNGLNPDHVLLAGTVLKLPTGAQAP